MSAPPGSSAEFDIFNGTGANSSGPKHLQSAQLLARLKLGRRDYQGAQEVLEKAALAAPSSPHAAVALAQIMLILGQPDKAEEQSVKALTLEPANAEALWTLAASQMARKQLDRAEVTFASVSALPDKRFSIRARAFSVPLSYLKPVFEKEPTPRHEFHLAMLYLRSGDRVTGARLMEAALKQNPNLPRQEKGW